LKQNGATSVVVMVTHAVLSGSAPKDIMASQIDKVIVTNTIPHDVKQQLCTKVNFSVILLFLLV
jgi:ribose-phosphate pyrophosphokinase